MRAKNSSAVVVSNSPVPTTPEELPRFLTDELARVWTAIQSLSTGHLDKSFAPPDKLRDGDFRYADGTTWKPNGAGGVGFWYYNGTTWIQLG